MTFEHFHSSGKIPVLIEQLKITVRDSERRSGQSIYKIVRVFEGKLVYLQDFSDFLNFIH
jgi:hypothetical protein